MKAQATRSQSLSSLYEYGRAINSVAFFCLKDGDKFWWFMDNDHIMGQHFIRRFNDSLKLHISSNAAIPNLLFCAFIDFVFLWVEKMPEISDYWLELKTVTNVVFVQWKKKWNKEQMSTYFNFENGLRTRVWNCGFFCEGQRMEWKKITKIPFFFTFERSNVSRREIWLIYRSTQYLHAW